MPDPEIEHERITDLICPYCGEIQGDAMFYSPSERTETWRATNAARRFGQPRMLRLRTPASKSINSGVYPVSKTICELLEQQDRHDLGDGWSVLKRLGGWMISHKGWSYDLKLANHEKRRIPDEPAYFPTACEAIAACESFKQSATWIA